MPGTGVTAREVMSKRVITVTPEATVLDAAKKMVRGRAGSVIVVSEGKPIGILTDSDIIKKVVSKDMKPSEVKVDDIMTSPIITARPEEDMLEVQRKMAFYKVKRIPVVEEGEVIGIITTTDIAMASPGMIETLRELLRQAGEEVISVEETMSGICEVCGNYSDNLMLVNGKWVCEICRGEE